MMFKKLLLPLLILGFFVFGYVMMQEGLPTDKNRRVYGELSPYIPYQLQKRVGGLNIISKLSTEIEKPPASVVFKRLEQLEKAWGKTHLALEGEALLVKDDSGKTIKSISLLDATEKTWVKTYFEL